MKTDLASVYGQYLKRVVEVERHSQAIDVGFLLSGAVYLLGEEASFGLTKVGVGGPRASSLEEAGEDY